MLPDHVVKLLVNTLREIAKAEVPYKRDPLEHAQDTVEAMQGKAIEALRFVDPMLGA